MKTVKVTPAFLKTSLVNARRPGHNLALALALTLSPPESATEKDTSRSARTSRTSTPLITRGAALASTLLSRTRSLAHSPFIGTFESEPPLMAGVPVSFLRLFFPA